MKLFFLKASLMGLLVGLTAVMCWKLADTATISSTNGWAAITNKHLYARTSAPTVWLVGGSNVMFGYNSQQLSSALRRPVINMGLGAALGLSFILNEAKAVSRPGDIVVLSLEYNLRDGDYNAQLNAAEFYPPAQQYIHYPTIMDWLKAQAHYRLRKARTGLNKLIYGSDFNSYKPSVDDTVSVYFKEAFSKQGDLISHLNNPAPRPLAVFNRQDYTPYSEYIARINEFIADARKRGVAVYFTYPPIAQSSYQTNEAVLKKWQRELQSQLKAPILTNPANTVYPDSLFFDTAYHLKQEGRDQNTLALLTKLKPYCQ